MNLGKIYVRESEEQFEAVEYTIDYIDINDDDSAPCVEYRVFDDSGNIHWFSYYPDSKAWVTYVDEFSTELKEIYVDRIDICPLGDGNVVNAKEDIQEDVCDMDCGNYAEHCAYPDSDMSEYNEVKFDYQERERLRGECAIRDVIIEALARDIINFRNK